MEARGWERSNQQSPQQPQPVQASDSPSDESPKASDHAAEGQLSKSRELYDRAFDLLNQTKYDEAARSFASFTRKYPKDPLIGNAFYWMGETYYIRRDYSKAADIFRQGYQAMPGGFKAGDNLLKLALSLEAMNKSKEACVVLRQVVLVYGNPVSAHAQQEIARAGCS